MTGILKGLFALSLRAMSTTERMRQVAMQQRRAYRTYEVTGFQAHVLHNDPPKSEEEVVSHINNRMDFIEKDSKDKPPDRLKIYTATEFNFFNPFSPVSASIHHRMIKAWMDRIERLPPGVLVVCGSDAVDTGKVSASGLKIGENIALVGEGGTRNHILIHKLSPDEMDGWDSSQWEVARHGDEEKRTFVVTDKATGEKHLFGIALCSEYGDNTLPDVQILLVPAAGMPDKIYYEHNYDLIVADNRVLIDIDSEVMDGSVNSSGLFEVRQTEGLLKKQLRRIVDNDRGAGLTFSHIVRSATLSSQTISDWLKKVDMKKDRVVLPTKDAPFWRTDKPRPFPAPTEKALELLRHLDRERRAGRVIEWQHHSPGEHGK